jgi:hypothetical protein
LAEADEVMLTNDAAEAHRLTLQSDAAQVTASWLEVGLMRLCVTYKMVFV